MKLTDEAEAAFIDAYTLELLSRVDTASLPSHAAVHAGLLAALPHLTDDGAAAPGGAPGNASAFGPSTGATPTAAPSSLPSITDAMVKAAARKRAEHYESEYDSTHLKWQDFAGEAREILEAAFGEGATPAIDREALERLVAHWSYNGNGLEPWQEGGGPDPYEAGLDDAATALRKLLDGAPNSGASKEDREALRAAERQQVAQSIRDEAVDEAVDGFVQLTAVIRMCEEAGR